MIFFNFPGLGMAIVGIIVGALTAHGTNGSPIAAAVGGAVAGGIDLYFRANNEGAWFHPRGGGHIWFIPVWCWAGVCALVGVIASLSPHH